MDKFDNDYYTLSELSGFNRIKKYYENNYVSSPTLWLRYKHTFNKSGKQGLTGLLNTKNPKVSYCFKLSKHIDHLIRHEWNIIQRLNTMSNFCPHFCRGVGMIKIKTNTIVNTKKNPFVLTDKKPIDSEMLLLEYLSDSCKFYNYIISPKIEMHTLYSIVKQVMIGILYAQTNLKFTHYDLHSNNIMMKKCDTDLVFLYVLDNNRYYYVPSYGHYPVIIDFGFSFADGMSDRSLYQTLSHTEIGFTCDRFDWLADFKLFLLTVSKEFRQKRDGKESKKFRQIVKNIFYKYPVDTDSGWDIHPKAEKGAVEYISKSLSKIKTPSSLFNTQTHYCIEIIQTAITTPMRKCECPNLREAYISFVTQFSKLEKMNRDTYSLLYILKGVIDSAKNNKKLYVTNRNKCATNVMNDLFQITREISSFCNINKIDKYIFVDSLYSIIQGVESMLYEFMCIKEEQQTSKKRHVPIKDSYQMIDVINYNVELDYTFNKDTVVFVFDNVKKDTRTFRLPIISIKTLNTLDNIDKAEFLYDVYKGFK